MSEDKNLNLKMKTKLEESQLVLCTVDRIIGTSVFVRLEDYNGIEGSISFPEIAPGRIRNIRDFVFPGKKIVCKILRVHPKAVELSLRRVKVNERNEFNDRQKKEKSYIALIKTILGNKAQEIIEKIKESEDLFELFENSKTNSKLLEKYLSLEEAEKIAKILREKESKTKELTISRSFSLSSKAAEGIKIVKAIISEASKGINCEISYVAAGKYLVKIRTSNPKQADSSLNVFIDRIEELSKKKYCNTCSFSTSK
jgi:translation initiation factor 2 alpha subunit (eIF-2alpha)